MGEVRTDDILRANRAAVIQKLKENVPDQSIIEFLVEGGIERDTAATFLRDSKDSFISARKQAGKRDMIVGALICAIGGIVTFVTYKIALEGGGKYIIAWGAIVFGAFQFFRGIIRSIDAL